MYFRASFCGEMRPSQRCFDCHRCMDDFLVCISSSDLYPELSSQLSLPAEPPTWTSTISRLSSSLFSSSEFKPFSLWIFLALWVDHSRLNITLPSFTHQLLFLAFSIFSHCQILILSPSSPVSSSFSLSLPYYSSLDSCNSF